jgi:radical SAM family uncharacterized protein/radical SAM-linked protein
MDLQHALETHVFPRVTKPGRYLGNEVNAVPRSAKLDARVRLCWAFPDLYDLGLGNLGLHILYHIVNRLPYAQAERVYAPARDMEALLREQGLPLFALESKDPLTLFDGIGFTLQSELTFTNILNMINMAGMSLRTEGRREEDPLTFAGGPAVFNPEPLAPFMDFFVIGDGEDVVVEICEVLDRVKGRAARLQALSELEGVYVPALYPFETLPDGRILPVVGVPPIRKRIAEKLREDDFPINFIVPWVRQVHDRATLEVLRGCTQGCRFCQAGMTTRPVRERTVDEVDQLMEKTLAATGYEEVGLVSLSTCDHSHVRQLVDRVMQRAIPERVGVSLPSLRLDSFSVELADMVADVRRTGLTFAPEAASPRLRAVINKWIPDEELLGMATQAYQKGWDHVKLYFMIGLPTERDDDVVAIADLTLRTLEEGRRWNPSCKVNTGVSTFVPKPFTPFQWAPQIDMAETERRQKMLSERFFRFRAVKFGRHKAAETWLEGQVSRADRRAADLIEAAWRHGARFDAWDEHLDVRIWLRAMEEIGWDAAYQLRERGLDERLPWDHLDVFIPKDWLRGDYEAAVRLEHAQDCRHSKCHKCGVIDEKRDLCAHMLRTAIDGRKEEGVWVRPGTLGPVPIPKGAKARSVHRKAEQVELARLQAEASEAAISQALQARADAIAAEPAAKDRKARAEPTRSWEEPTPVQRLILRIGITGEARHLSHLETLNAWLRTLRRIKAPLSYSQGFHPHPKMAFSGARPVGEQTLGDYMEVTLHSRRDPATFAAALSSTAPPGFHVYGAVDADLHGDALMSRVAGAEYLFFVEEGLHLDVDVTAAVLAERVAAVHAAEGIPVVRESKKGRRKFDLQPHIRRLALRPAGGSYGQVLDVALDVHDGRGCKPSEIITLLGLDAPRVRVVRLDTRFEGELVGALAGVKVSEAELRP